MTLLIEGASFAELFLRPHFEGMFIAERLLTPHLRDATIAERFLKTNFERTFFSLRLLRHSIFAVTFPRHLHMLYTVTLDFLRFAF